MTEIQNPKQLVFDLIWDLEIVTWNLFGPILKSGGVCNLLFPVLSVFSCPEGATFSERSLGNSLGPIYWNHIMFAHDLCHSQIEYFSNAINLNWKDRAKPPARRGCSAYASESDTTNLQFSIFNIQFPDKSGSPLRADPGIGITATRRPACPVWVSVILRTASDKSRCAVGWYY